jgi:hypothetical protein
VAAVLCGFNFGKGSSTVTNTLNSVASNQIQEQLLRPKSNGITASRSIVSEQQIHETFGQKDMITIDRGPSVGRAPRHGVDAA